MIVRARAPIVLGGYHRRGASHAGYRRLQSRGLGVTINCVTDPEACRNPTPAILSLDQTNATASTAKYAPPVYTCPNCAGMSTDPSVFQSAAYVTQLNALGATSAVNDANARRFANFQNAYANALYSGSALPTPPVYMTHQRPLTTSPTKRGVGAPKLPRPVRRGCARRWRSRRRY